MIRGIYLPACGLLLTLIAMSAQADGLRHEPLFETPGQADCRAPAGAEPAAGLAESANAIAGSGCNSLGLGGEWLGIAALEPKPDGGGLPGDAAGELRLFDPGHAMRCAYDGNALPYFCAASRRDAAAPFAVSATTLVWLSLAGLLGLLGLGEAVMMGAGIKKSTVSGRFSQK